MGTGQYALDKPMAAIGQGLLGFSQAMQNARDYQLQKEQIDSQVAERALQGKMLQRQIDQQDQVMQFAKGLMGDNQGQASGAVAGALPNGSTPSNSPAPTPGDGSAPTGGLLSANLLPASAKPAQDTQDLINYAGKYYGVDPNYITSLITNGELNKNFDPNSVSPKGATGIMQVMPATAQSLGVDPTKLKDPATNIMAGTQLISQLQSKYPGRPDLVAAAYNAGPGAVDAAKGVPNIPETQSYVGRMFAPAGPQTVTDGSAPSPASSPLMGSAADPMLAGISQKIAKLSPIAGLPGPMGEYAKAQISALDQQRQAYLARTPEQTSSLAANQAIATAAGTGPLGTQEDIAKKKADADIAFANQQQAYRMPDGSIAKVRLGANGVFTPPDPAAVPVSSEPGTFGMTALEAATLKANEAPYAKWKENQATEESVSHQMIDAISRLKGMNLDAMGTTADVQEKAGNLAASLGIPLPEAIKNATDIGVAKKQMAMMLLPLIDKYTAAHRGSPKALEALQSTIPDVGLSAPIINGLLPVLQAEHQDILNKHKFTRGANPLNYDTLEQQYYDQRGPAQAKNVNDPLGIR